MCLTIKNTTGNKIDVHAAFKALCQIAPCDMIVYKVIAMAGPGKYAPAIASSRGVTYELGEEYYQTDEEDHFTYAWSFWGSGYRDKIDIERGLHAATTSRAAREYVPASPNRVVVRCIIPKGSIYLTNGTEIVSNRIRLEEVEYIATGTASWDSKYRRVNKKK